MKLSCAGLQLQRGVEDITTVEAALEEAIFKAGGILESNRGALHKIDWSRSSRTDKGVHSCSTVIGLKMECVVESFESDPEGLGIAGEINKHLPGQQVRVLSVQRTTQKFDARQICEGRVYSYFLPTSIIGLELDGSEEDRERLRLLRECLALYEGVHAFHNFTKRRLYRTSQRKQGRGAKRKGGGRVTAGAWNEERDEADPITRSHFRHIFSATADDPTPLVPGGTPCIKVVFSGQSFMLHQIRHMIGAAVAVARGTIPLDYVEGCLRSPSRAIMPLAPPHVLVLSETVMMQWRDEQARAMLAHTTGERLTLRSGGLAAQQAFLSEVLHPAINDLLQAKDWEWWEGVLQRIVYDEAEMAAFLTSHAESKARLEQHRAERQAEAAAFDAARA
ncbi:pseudouridine synthase [Coccomyxa subellipsoidea C-169]|uniref:Pseudouridine synthase n=1 Tax=Coccomyxa subellipsoidea (strain C-169) TaxID=574566 RepID=I0Z2B4_COCSC|nr:pseudouridine synthase [Coccomyxa subellipsoidea C-169]EIE24783.1 pseudouridine synthase [Coccomyxa subellipsoidea C-169]|eukprot:XP_005649327.1 pseudouridine synthase [Coccomyxa subellipsoidea C-169]